MRRACWGMGLLAGAALSCGSGGSGFDATGSGGVSSGGSTFSTGGTVNGTGGASSGGGGTGGGGGMSDGGSAGDGGGAGDAGLGTPEICSFDIESTLSSAIPTVGVVEWSTDLAGLSGARVEFTLDDPHADELNRGSGGPIDVSGDVHRALLLGLKPERSYTYRIVANDGELECISADHSLTTGVALGAPVVTRTAVDPAAQAPGFVMTTDYGSRAYIFDADGEVVWWADSPSQCTRATMDWEGDYMWMLAGNPSESLGEVWRISMDGTEVLAGVEGLAAAHHDLTVLPGGIVATLLWTGEPSGSSDLVERAPDGELTVVARIDATILMPLDDPYRYHTNAVLYHAWDDSYTVGDRAAGFAKLTRGGEPVWNFASSCEDTLAPKCAAGPTAGSHGHHLLPSGRFLFLTVSPFSTIYEYTLTETENSLTAIEEWAYSDGVSSTSILGDVQLLPNDNRLITYSNEGDIHEVSPEDEIVQVIASDSLRFGYSSFRETLYGPPAR